MHRERLWSRGGAAGGGANDTGGGGPGRGGGISGRGDPSGAGGSL